MAAETDRGNPGNRCALLLRATVACSLASPSVFCHANDATVTDLSVRVKHFSFCFYDKQRLNRQALMGKFMHYTKIKNKLIIYNLVFVNMS